MDRHVLGTCDRGKIWIRLHPSGNGLAIALYTLFGATEKYPLNSITLDDAKLQAELMLNELELVDELAGVNKAG